MTLGYVHGKGSTCMPDWEWTENPITFSLNAGIRFDGVIVDFGELLRPSIPETREIIDNYLLDCKH